MGLDKIISTQEQVGGLQEQLTAMEPVLIKTQAEVEVMIITIIQDKEEAGKTQRTVSTLFEHLLFNCAMHQLYFKWEHLKHRLREQVSRRL